MSLVCLLKMHRRCIVCGLEPGDKCVYPRNMVEARRWQNLANLSTFDVDTESLCQHGCVCSSHLNMVHEFSSDPGSTPEAARAPRTAGGKASAQSQKPVDQRPSVKWSSSETGQEQPIGHHDYVSGSYYPTNKKAIAEMQSKQSLDSKPQERNNGSRCYSGHYRCSGARCQGNLCSQMGQNYASEQASYCTAPKRNFKANQPTPPERNVQVNQCTASDRSACLNCSLLRNPQPVQEACSYGMCHRRNLSDPQKTQRNTQQRPQSCDKHCCSILKQLHSRGEDDFHSLASTTTTGHRVQCFSSGSKSTPDQQQKKKKPDVKSQCCQASIKCQLMDREVQCSTHALHPKASSTAGGTCSSSQRAGSSRTISSKGFSSTGTINMSNCGTGCEQQNPNAVNVLLMNGSRQNKYGGPSTEICVQESDLADCNEKAVFPAVDKPSYRVCRAATSDPNAKCYKEEADQNETNVLVLEQSSITGSCFDFKSDQAQGQGKVEEKRGGSNLSQNQSKDNSQTKSQTTVQRSGGGQMDENSNNALGAADYSKVLEQQRARITELENLLQQQNTLQQTIQARMAELQWNE